MVSSVAFKTRARTIDHLGREQIADCPTAVSELWKNAYDAYARTVELHIFDGDIPTAALVDNGHGMCRNEFEDKWLTIGTESKASGGETPEADRDGLPVRQKQGQKGIGRLSSAALGSLLLIISKRRNMPFAAALIDWRLFENPFLMLHDIKIPVVEFDRREELNELLPPMFDTLMSNLNGDGKDNTRDVRLEIAWQNYDLLEADAGLESTKSKIEETVIKTCFDDRHFGCWDVWTEKSSKGTALFMAGIHDDLRAQLSADSIGDLDSPEIRARERMYQTLSNFTDPFVSAEEAAKLEFSSSVIGWIGQLKRPILDTTKEFDISNLEALEHVVHGSVDEDGTFTGRVKIFNIWHDNITIKPRKTAKARKDTRFGPFALHIGAFEGNAGSSSLPEDLHAFYLEMADRYAGFRVYRDGLRVMPYGREDNDYFEIEKRRSINAGRNFWSNRRLYGRAAITRKDNPNLKDKAGREGIIDNKASKLFRDVVENILKETAKRFFGSDNEDRKDKIKDNKADKDAARAIEDRKKWLKKERKRVQSLIKVNVPPLQSLITSLQKLSEEVTSGQHLETLEEVQILRNTLSNHSETLKGFSLSPIPPNLGTVEDDYRDYRRLERRAQAHLSDLHATANNALEHLCPKSTKEIVQAELQRNAAHLHSRVRKWAKEGKELLNQEIQRFNEMIDECNKAYHAEVSPILEDVEHGRTDFTKAMHMLDDAYQIQDLKNSQKLQPYVSALLSLRDQIDLEGLASHSMKESIELKKEADRLSALAQLGITVEIIGHEIEGLDMTIARGLKSMPESIKDLQAYKDVIFAHQGLSDRWRFLSPLKLSGERTKVDITGQMIIDYTHNFFGGKFENSEIDLQASDEFKKLRIYEQPARIYPVFINLINNSRYWVRAGDAENQRILLDVQDSSVVIADNGPGVDEEDLSQLFTLFFTRKQRDGRGVGLYLCKTNLQAGGHTIRYENIEERKLLPGANFVIEFRGATYE